MKKLVVCLTAVLLTACSLPKINEQYRGIVDTTYALTKENGDRFCSATKVDYRKLLTAAHCAVIEDFWVEAPNGHKVKGKWLILKKDQDLAIVEADVFGPNARIMPSEPYLGDEVIAAGFPLGLRLILTQGLWMGPSTFDMAEGKIDRYMVTSPVTNGNSGGGIWVRVGDRYFLAGVLQAVPVNLVGGMFPNLVSHLAVISHFSQFRAILREAH